MEHKVSFGKFSKKYWWIYVILALLLGVPILIYCWVFIKELKDVSAWASIIAGIATYLGAAFLGVLVYYNSWVQTELANRLDEIDILISPKYMYKDGYHVPFTKEDVIKFADPSYEFISRRSGKIIPDQYPSIVQFTFRNNNCYTPIAVSIEGIYYLDENMEMKKCEQVEIARNVPERIFFDCHSPTVAFYGMSSNILKHDYYKNNSVPNISFVFRISNTKGAVKYYVYNAAYHKSVLENSRFLSEKQYIQNTEKQGYPIIITPFNRQVRKLRENINEV